MPKHSKPISPPPAPGAPASITGPLWPAFLLVAVCSAAAGALGMWVFVQTRPAVRSAPPAAQISGVPAVQEPPLELAAGLPPAQAARTLGDFYYDRENWPRAIGQYEAAIREGSDDADIRTDLANAYQFSGRAQNALAQYQAAQRMNPQHEASLFNLGVLYADGLNDPVQAITTWQEFLRRFPVSVRAADARQAIAAAQARATGTLPTGHPPIPGPVSPPAASGRVPAVNETDVQELLRLVRPAEKPVPNSEPPPKR